MWNIRYYREEQSRKELLITLNSISEGVIATDAGGRVVRMNPFAQKLTGWSEDDAKNRLLDEVFRIVSGVPHEPIGSPVKEALRTGRVVKLTNDTLLIAKDGEKHQIADGAAPIRDEHGGLHGVVLVFRDVTSEYNTIMELKDAEYCYRRGRNALHRNRKCNF
jgi:PAS domain S-box-containing protein